MNAHQRKKLAAAHHYRMPLGSAVKVRNNSETYIGVVHKHDRGQRCIVEFEQHNPLTLATHPDAAKPFAWITYYNVRPVAVNRVRPWWRKMREQHGLRSTR